MRKFLQFLSIFCIGVIAVSVYPIRSYASPIYPTIYQEKCGSSTDACDPTFVRCKSGVTESGSCPSSESTCKVWCNSYNSEAFGLESDNIFYSPEEGCRCGSGANYHICSAIDVSFDEPFAMLESCCQELDDDDSCVSLCSEFRAQLDDDSFCPSICGVGWYQDEDDECIECPSLPGNAVYVWDGTVSEEDDDDTGPKECQWECVEGYYRVSDGAGNEICVDKIICEAGTYLPENYATQCQECSGGWYYCPGGEFSPSADPQGLSSCRTDTEEKYTDTDTGAASINDCYLIAKPGEYVRKAGEGVETCPCGYYCPSYTKIYYGGSVSGRKKIGGRILCGDEQYNPDTGSTNVSACQSVPVGYHAKDNLCGIDPNEFTVKLTAKNGSDVGRFSNNTDTHSFKCTYGSNECKLPSLSILPTGKTLVEWGNCKVETNDDGDGGDGDKEDGDGDGGEDEEGE